MTRKESLGFDKTFRRLEAAEIEWREEDLRRERGKSLDGTTEEGGLQEASWMLPGHIQRLEGQG